MTDENLLIIELIREWLRFNQFTSTHSVFMAETGAPVVPLDRPELSTLVGVADDAQSAQLCVRRTRLARGARCESDCGCAHTQAAAV